MMMTPNNSQDATACLLSDLEDALEQINSTAVKAEADAEDARTNARAAMEIARRYDSRESAVNTNTMEQQLSNDANSKISQQPASSLRWNLPQKANNRRGGGRYHPGSAKKYNPTTAENLLPQLYSHYSLHSSSKPSSSSETKTEDFVGKSGNRETPASLRPSPDHNIGDVPATPKPSPPLPPPPKRTNGTNGISSSGAKQKPNSMSSLSSSFEKSRRGVRAMFDMKEDDAELHLAAEVERLKSLLSDEQHLHKQTKLRMEALAGENADLTAAVERSRADRNRLKREVATLRAKCMAGEEDAAMALDLAKQSDAERTKVEEYLQHAAEEVEKLKTQLKQQQQSNQLPRHPQATVSKELVRVGKKLLLKKKMAGLNNDSTSTDHNIVNSNNNAAYCYHVNLARSSEKRAQLRNKMRQIASLTPTLPLSENIPSAAAVNGGDKRISASPPSGGGVGVNLSNNRAYLTSDTCESVVNMIRQSGKRIGLAGLERSLAQNGGGSSGDVAGDTADDRHRHQHNIENITSAYCSSVETKIRSQKEEAREMESLCEYLEEKIANATAASTISHSNSMLSVNGHVEDDLR